jgi:hypothetical protein
MPAPPPFPQIVRSKIPYSAADLEKRILTLPKPPPPRIWTVSAVEVDNWTQILTKFKGQLEETAYEKYAKDIQ